MPLDDRTHPPFYTPRIWHGMTSGVWFRCLRDNGFAISPSRFIMTAIVSNISLANSVLRFSSELIHKRRAESAAFDEPPLFVIGHWRTGTTLLHELLVKDERFSFPTTYQCMLPSHFLITERLFGRVLGMLLPNKRPMDNMTVGHERPQEDEFALLNLGALSNYTQWGFPNQDVDYADYLTLENASEAEIENWKTQFRWFVQRLALSDSRRLVLKSPTHTARVKLLAEMFPDARFLHIVRNPIRVLPSTIKTWERMTEVLELQTRKDEVTLEERIRIFNRMYDRFFNEKDDIPNGQLHELSYEDLVNNPIESLQTAYRALDLGNFEPARRAVQDYLESTKGFKRNRHNVPDEMKQQIMEGCKEYCRRYGYLQ